VEYVPCDDLQKHAGVAGDFSGHSLGAIPEYAPGARAAQAWWTEPAGEAGISRDWCVRPLYAIGSPGIIVTKAIGTDTDAGLYHGTLHVPDYEDRSGYDYSEADHGMERCCSQ